MSSIVNEATIRPYFGVGYMSTFFIRNEIISDDIQKCQNILFFIFLILHRYHQ